MNTARLIVGAFLSKISGLRHAAGLLALVLLASGCMVGPVDGARVPNRSSNIDFGGYYVEANVRVVVEAYNNSTREWVAVGSGTSAATKSFTTIDGFDAYSWNAGRFALPNAFWKPGSRGHYARVRAKVGDLVLKNMVANWEDCFVGGLSAQRLYEESCFSWREEAYIYTSDYTIAPRDCPEASGIKTHDHYMLEDLPTCAQLVVREKMVEHINRSVIRDHHEINYDSARDTEAISPVVVGGQRFEMGGFLAGRRRYLQRMERKLSVHSYSWMPYGRLPAFEADDRVTPSIWRDAVESPNGSCPSEICSGWISGTLPSTHHPGPRPAKLGPDRVCTYTTAQALHTDVESWDDYVRNLLGLPMNVKDAPSLPLFFLWQAYVDDVYSDWQDCAERN